MLAATGDVSEEKCDESHWDLPRLLTGMGVVPNSPQAELPRNLFLYLFGEASHFLLCMRSPHH